jgi:hypothetical protein
LGKKLLLKAEEALEGKSDLVDAEKRIEASLAALKDGNLILCLILCLW